MKKHNGFKRVLAGVLAVLTVAAYMPANVGGLLTGDNAIVASAAKVNGGDGYRFSCFETGDIIYVGDKICAEGTDGTAFGWQDPGKIFIDDVQVASIELNGGAPWKFSWTCTCKCEVTKLEGHSLYLKKLSTTIAENNSELELASAYYNGQAIEVEVRCNNKLLTKDTDYTLTVTQGEGNDVQTVTEIKDSGVYHVEVKGIGEYDSYSGTLKKDVTVNKFTPTNSCYAVALPDLQQLIYDGASKDVIAEVEQMYKDYEGMSNVVITYYKLDVSTLSRNALMSTRLLSATPTIPDSITVDGKNYKKVASPNQAGEYIVRLTVQGNDNIEGVTLSDDAKWKFTLSQRVVGITWGDNVFTYNEQSQIPTATATNLVGNDTCTVNLTGEQINAGNYTATAASLSNSNYTLPAEGTTKAFHILSKLDFTEALSPKAHITSFECDGKTVTGRDADNYNVTSNFANTYDVPVDAEITIKATGVLEFPEGLTDFSFTQDKNSYTYTFKIPQGVNEVKVNHVYDYSLTTDNPNTEEEELDSLFGYDRNDKTDTEYKLLAQLASEDVPYLADLKTGLNRYNNFVLSESNVDYVYESKTDGVALVDNLPVNVGEYSVKAGATVGEASYWMTDDFKITPRAFAANTQEIQVALQSSDFTYNKNEQTPVIVVTDANAKLTNHTLVEGTDYELGYLDANGQFVKFGSEGAEKTLAQTNAGTYTVAVNFIGNYSGTTTIDWTIKKQTLADLTITPDADLAYDAQEHPVTVTATDERALPEDAADLFYIGYVPTSLFSSIMASAQGDPNALVADQYLTAPVNAGDYTAVVIVKDGNYQLNGTQTYQTQQFAVTPKEITVIPTAAEKTYGELDPTGFTCKTEDSLAISEEKDFSAYIIRETGENAGTYAFQIKNAVEGALIVGNYKISIANTENVFTINKKEIQPIVAVAEGPHTFTGAAIEPTVTVNDGQTVIPATEYRVVFAENINVGTATVTVTNADDGNYVVAEGSAEFTIQPKSIAGVTIEVPDEQYVADGETAFKPAVTVKDGQTVLTADKDYTVSYEKNVNAGTAKVTVTGKNNYSSETSKDANFVILATLDVSDVKANITKIEYDNAEVTLTGNDTYTFEPGKTIKVYSKETLAGTTFTDDDRNNDLYWYSFVIPENTNLVTLTHNRDYYVRTDGDKVYGTDRNLVGATEQLLATLITDNIRYLDDVDQKVYVKTEDGVGVTVSNVVYTYEVISGGTLVNGKPATPGTYRVTAKAPINGTNYYLKKQFTVLPREYESNTAEIKVSVTNASTVFNGEAVIPQIVVTDSKRAEGEQALIRGTDYQIGYYNNNNEFVPVTNDVEYFTGSAAGSYSVTVEFVGNYTGKVIAAWRITNAALPLLTITADSDLVFDNEPHPVTVATADTTATLPEDAFKILYGGQDATAEDVNLSETAPTNAGTYKAFIKLNDAANNAFAAGQETEITFTITPKDIESEDIVIDYPTVSILDGWTTCDPIIVKYVKTNGTEVVLAEGEDKDYTVSLNSTNKVKDHIPVLINGKGNYTGNTYLDWSIVSGEDAVTLSISEPTATVNASGNGRVTATFTSEVLEGLEIVERGILYVKDASCTTELTVENALAGTAGIGKKINTTAYNEQTLNVIDTGSGAKMRGYVTVKNGTTNKTFYTEEVSDTYKALTIDSAATVSISAPTATVNASGVGRVTATFDYTLQDGYTVTEKGILYVKNANCATELTLDAVGTDGIAKKVNTTDYTSQTLNVTDTDGKGAKMRGYVTVTADGISKTFYTDEVSGVYTSLAIDSAATVSISAPTATVNASGVGRVTATFDYMLQDGYTVTEKGILYVKNANCATELTLDAVGTEGIAKKVNATDYTSQTLNVTDPDGKGAKMRGYVTVTNGTVSKTFYSDEVSGTYSALGINSAATVNITDPIATVNASGVGRVTSTFDYTLKDGYTVTEKGILYVKNASCATELTLDTVGTDGIAKKVNATDYTSQTLNVTDPDGNGAKMRGYVTVTDGTSTKTIYSQEVSGKYADLSNEE